MPNELSEEVGLFNDCWQYEVLAKIKKVRIERRDDLRFLDEVFIGLRLWIRQSVERHHLRY